MSPLEITLLILSGLLVLIIASFWFFRRSATQNQGLNILSQNLGQLSQQLHDSLHQLNERVSKELSQSQLLSQQTQTTIGQRLDSSHRTLSDLKEQLGQLSQATQTILQAGSEIKKLQDILQRPGLRGGLGEWLLENLLAEILPHSAYTIQHRFSDGNIVDAIVKLPGGNISIDAKFPLSNFQTMLQQQDPQQREKTRKAFLRDVCKHIDDISKKYIRPREGTLDFALMYIPAENVYYHLITKIDPSDPDITAYGQKQKVIPTSPNTLYAYLMIITTGLKGIQIEQNAQLIRKQLSQFQHDIQLLTNDFSILGKHMGNARGKYEDTARHLDALTARLQQIDTQQPDTQSDNS